MPQNPQRNLCKKSEGMGAETAIVNRKSVRPVFDVTFSKAENAIFAVFPIFRGGYDGDRDATPPASQICIWVTFATMFKEENDMW